MSEAKESTTRETGKAARRGGGKPSGGAKRKADETSRLQVHLSKEVVKRLGVHCSLREKNWSEEVERILMRYLKGEGSGRQLFSNSETPDEEESPGLAG